MKEKMFELVEHIPKLIIATVIGGCVGAERAMKNKSVGYGTCATITLTTTMLTILGEYALGGEMGGRFISNIITAIGFLCGSVIFVRHNSANDDDEIVGLTTGAILFCLASIGVAIGLGYYVFVTVAVVLVLINVSISKSIRKIFVKDDVV